MAEQIKLGGLPWERWLQIDISGPTDRREVELLIESTPPAQSSTDFERITKVGTLELQDCCALVACLQDIIHSIVKDRRETTR